MFDISKDLKYLAFVDTMGAYNERQIELIIGKFYNGRMRDFRKYYKYLVGNFPIDVLNKIINENKLHKKKAFEFDPATLSMGKDVVNINVAIKKYIKQFPSMSENGYSLYFYGDNSTGKTFSALFCLYHLINRNNNLKFYYLTFRDLVQLYNKVHFSSDSNYIEDAANEQIMNCDIIILDEIGGKEGRITQNVLGIFEEIIKYRAQNCLPMIVIGNTRPYVEDDSPESLKSTAINLIYGQSCYAAMTEKFRFFGFSSKLNPNFRTKTSWNFE